MRHFDEVIQLQEERFIEELKDSDPTVDKFCKTVFIIVGKSRRRYAKRSGYVRRSIPIIFQIAAQLRDINRDLKIGQLTSGSEGYLKFKWLITSLITPKTVDNPIKEITFTTPEEFMDKIREG